MEPANKFLKVPQALKKSYNSDLMSATIKNLERELADHEKLHQGVEAAIELKLKETVD